MNLVHLNDWQRSSHYKVFSRAQKPQFSICSNVDVSNLVGRETNFFNHFLFILMKCSNEIEEFKYRIIDNKVYYFDKLDINFNLLAKNKCFVSHRVAFHDNFNNFDQVVQKIKDSTPEVGELNIDNKEGQNVVITSFIPWTHFNSINEPIFTQQESLIKIVYGKYSNDGERYTLPVSVTAHHGLVDGVHISKFFSLIEKEIIAIQ